MMSIPAWLIWAILSAVFAALMTVLAKAGLRDVHPDLAQLIRTAVILPTLAAFVLLTSGWRDTLNWSGRTWVFLVLSGLATGASWVCYFRALNAGDASRVAAVDKLSVVLVAILATILLREHVNSVSWGGIILISIGLVMVSLAK